MECKINKGVALIINPGGIRRWIVDGSNRNPSGFDPAAARRVPATHLQVPQNAADTDGSIIRLNFVGRKGRGREADKQGREQNKRGQHDELFLHGFPPFQRNPKTRFVLLSVRERSFAYAQDIRFFTFGSE